MCYDDGGESFEEFVRSIADEIGRSVQRAAEEVDLDGIAGTLGIDPDRAREWFDFAGNWVRSQAERLGEDLTRAAPAHREDLGHTAPAHQEDLRHGAPVQRDDPLRGAAPHPLDVPTEDQGLALAALDSGRWTVEPGTNALSAVGEGRAPSDALGLVRELRARDWIGADGRLTVTGRHALTRWLDAKP